MSLSGNNVVFDFSLSVKLNCQSVASGFFALLAHVQGVLGNLDLWERTTVAIVL